MADSGRSIPVKGRGHWFDGTAEADVSVNSNVGYMKFNHSFSIMTWVKVPSITDTKQTIVSRSQAGNPVTNRLDFYLVSTNSTATLGLEVLNDGADVYSDTHSTVPSNEWAWLTVTRDWVAKTVTLSINDSAKTAVSAEDLFILENDTTELTIGMKYDPT